MKKIAEKSENLKKTTKCGGAGAARPTPHLVQGWGRFFNEGNERGDQYEQITTTHVLAILNPFMPEKDKNDGWNT